MANTLYAIYKHFVMICSMHSDGRKWPHPGAPVHSIDQKNGTEEAIFEVQDVVWIGRAIDDHRDSLKIKRMG